MFRRKTTRNMGLLGLTIVWLVSLGFGLGSAKFGWFD